VDFGGGVLTSAGGDEVFVVKFDPAGNHLWSKRFGDSNHQYSQNVSVDRWDNVLLSGQFYGTIDFGGGVLTSAGNNDIYIAKFDAAGNHIWSQGWGDASKQYGHCTITDGSGNVFLVGEFQGTVNFGGGPLTSAGDYDAYVAMFDAAGSHIWSRGFGDPTHQRAISAAVDGAGNVVITGDFQGAVDPGGGALASAGSDDVFTAKYDAAGNHMWSHRYGDAGSQIGECVALDNSANVLLTGYFQGNLDFGGGVLSSAGGDDIFLAKFSTTTEISVAPEYDVTNCTTRVPYTFHIDHAGFEEIRGYDVTFQIDPAVVTIADITVSTGDVAEGSYLSSVGGTAFFVLNMGSGLYQVNCAILGGATGATGAGDLFTVEFTPVAEGTSSITITGLDLRDVNNVSIVVVGADGTVQVDCTPPTMQAIVEPQSKCYRAAPSFSTFRFRDDVNLDLADYQVDTDGWTSIFVGIDDTLWVADGWTLPGFGGLSEGSHTIYFRVKDDAGNWNGEGAPQPALYSWQFIKDTTPPDSPTDFVAMPGHNKVHLTWTNVTGDGSFVGVEIRRVGWGDYPEFGTGTPVVPPPDYPANETEGTLVTQTALEAHEDDPVTPRDVYYYAAFSYDCAGNYSAASTSARDRSTSYWLGDTRPPVYDGNVNSVDLVAFSGTFGESEGDPGWDTEVDFGPSDDYSRFGVPEPDDVIDFEDLMIFAMNYGNVAPSGTSGLLAVASSEVPLRDAVGIELIPLSSDGATVSYAIVIDNRATTLKGIALYLSSGPGSDILDIRPPVTLLGRGSDHFFGTIERESGKATVCVASLGVDRAFVFSGVIALVTVREGAGDGPPVILEKADMRDLDNRREEVTLAHDGGETRFVPTVSALYQNHPNPFNPVTTIGFDIPEQASVKLSIYDVSGKLVRTLVDEEMDSGRKTVIWNGRDMAGREAASGVYFYYLETPAHRQSKKMILLR
jgi:hypothetical protein